MTSLSPSPSPWSVNDWGDFWRYQVGVNVIPADTRNKTPLVKWIQYQNSPIPEEQHNLWKSANAFENGVSIIVGKVWYNSQKKGLFLIFVDLDNRRAIEEFCTRNGRIVTLQELSKNIIIEQHKDDPDKAHAYFYSKHPYRKKSSDKSSLCRFDKNEIPAIEVKGLGEHGLAFCSPSTHKNGHNYEIIGTLEPEIIDDLELHIDTVLRKYNIPYLDGHLGKNSKTRNSLIPINELFQPDTKIFDGHNRHEALLRIIESLLSRNGRVLELGLIKNIALQWNQGHCVPPLDNIEFGKQWNDAIKFVQKCEDKKQFNKNENSLDRVKQNNDTREDSENQTQSNVEILVRLIQDIVKLFFKDQYGTPFALIMILDHIETVALESTRFRRFMAKIFYDQNKRKIISTDAINNAIQILQAQAEYEGPTVPVHLRVAWSPNRKSIYYHMTDEKWRYVHITNEDRDVLNDSASLFVKFNQTPQVEPQREYQQEIFEKFIALTNVKNNQTELLLKVYIVSLLIPEIPHPILILDGEKGSTKSTLQTLIKMLVDPAKPTLLTVYNDRNEFIQQLNHNHVAYYDNIKNVPKWLSDEACKAVTGIGQTKRKLYTNDEDIVYEYKRCLGFNGINISLTEPDALDRSIMIQLERVRKEERKLDSDIYAGFEELRPGLLGCIFDILVRVLQIIDSIKLTHFPRMADFALWGEATARAMGYKEMEFIEVYYKNIELQTEEVLESSPVAACIRYFMLTKDEWIGTASQLLYELEQIAETLKINVNSKFWPKAPNYLSRRLREIMTNLREIGILLEWLTDSNSKTRIIKICKVSSVSSLSPEDHNQAQLSFDNVGDMTMGTEPISPENNDENRAQNPVAGDTGDKNDTLHPSNEQIAGQENNNG